MKPVLDITNLQAGYNELDVLHGVDLKVHPGELVAIIGPNGAGKSTVLKSIFNLADVRAGKIELHQENITGLPTHQLLRKGVSYVPQGRINFSHLTVQENLVLASEDKKRLEAVYKQFPALQQKRSEPAYSLSGGQHQMLALGRALMHQPQLLLMDEPSLGLAPKLITELFSTIKDLTNQGIAVLLVEQNAKQAIQAANKTYLLEQGRVALSGEDITKHKKIKQVYLGGDVDE